MKQNIKTYIYGIITGVGLMLAVFFIYSLYDHNTRWDGRTNPAVKVQKIFDILESRSIMPFNRHEMLNSMYRGLLDGMEDPYTRFLDAETLAAFTERTEGAYSGIGVQVLVNPYDLSISVSTAFSGSPAQYAGMLPGDVFVRVDDVNVLGKPLEELIALIRGPIDTPVTITVYRPLESEHIDFHIVRSRIEVPTVFHDVFIQDNKTIGFIRLEGFERVSLNQFNSALDELIESEIQGLIIDVRNNPGGQLGAVNGIADRILPEGIITFVQDNAGNREYHRSRPGALDLPIVMVVNGRSASASELLAAAVRDLSEGLIIGTQTFGKGTVQQQANLPDNTAIIVTIAEYFTPGGESIHGVGITPDIIIDLDEVLQRRIGHLELSEDVQLQAALDALAEKIRTLQHYED